MDSKCLAGKTFLDTGGDSGVVRVNLKSSFIQDFLAKSTYMTDRLQIIQENFYNSKTSMELHYMLPR